MAIRSFRHRGLKRFYEFGDASRINAVLVNRIQDILAVLDSAKTLAEANIPGYRLHPLKGALRGFWSIAVSGNWRIVFRFDAGDAFDLDLTDYH